MEPLSLAHMVVMLKADADEAVKDERLEIIASKTIVRRSILSDAQVAVVNDIIRQGRKYKVKVLSYYKTISEST